MTIAYSPPHYEARRAVVTGLGAITPVGQGKDGLWAGVLAGKSMVRRVQSFDASAYRSQIAAEIPDFDPTQHMGTQQCRRLERYSQFCLAAAGQAWSDSGLAGTHLEPDRVGVTVGSALGGIVMAERESAVFFQRGLRRVNPLLALSVFGGAGPCNIAIEFGFTGPTTANSNSCASGTVAVGDALRMIQRGEVEAVIAVGAEAPIAPLCYGAFSVIRAMSARNDDPGRACRPFDRDRDGFVMGEGAGALVIESRAHARARGARIYAEVLGYALTNDGHHMTAPRPDGSSAARAISLALRDAGVPADQVDHVNAHGSSTPLNDPVETTAIKAALGPHAADVPVSGTKGLYGHPLGAAGAIEAVISVLAIERSMLPPTANLEHPAPDCDLDLVGPAGRSQSVNCVLSNSFGFGGINACVVLVREGFASCTDRSDRAGASTASEN
ncbi:MAG: beta-ketoacyl-ACP synthase II [Armatimonadota bacterium]